MILDAVVCIALIASVVLQSSKSSGMGGSISGGADAVFGGKAKGLDAFLIRVTMILAALFGIITLLIAKLSI
jgi:preprotein translocase subunit SecG